MTQPASPLAAALAAAQAEIVDPPRNKKMSVPGRKERTYAGLDDILRTVRPVLAKHGLAITQGLQTVEGKVFLITQLRHSGGEMIASSWEIAWKGSPQDRGSEVTYGRRYTLEALVGVAATDDDDAESISQPEPTRGKRGQNRNIDTEPTAEHQLRAAEIAADKEMREAAEADRKARHHPSWPAAHKGFAGDVARLNLNVGLVMDLGPMSPPGKPTEDRPMGKRPSQMDPKERAAFLAWLESDAGARAYDGLVAEREMPTEGA